MAFYHQFRPYVPVAERRRQAEQTARKMAGKGRALAPIRLEGRAISRTFWGRAWCDNLEAYSDFANRLPRGRTYVRNGSVIDLQIAAGQVTALVQGSSLYRITIGIAPLPAARWRTFAAACAGQVTNLLDLLQGRLSKDILTALTTPGTGLFPTPAEIKLDCSCPDWAEMCKHVAAALYGVGARLDEKPELFFTLRGVDMQELVTAASVTATAPLGEAPADALAGADLEALFGVQMDPNPTPTPAAKPAAKAKAKPTAKRKAAAPPKPVKPAKAKRKKAHRPARKARVAAK